MKISCLVSEDCIMVGLTGALDMFGAVNKLLMENGEDPFFEIELVSIQHRNIHTPINMSIYCHRTIQEIDSTCDLILVPAFMDPVEGTRKSYEFIPFLKKQHAMGAELASMCSGAFMLAETGLLKGKEATTHWYSADLFAEMYPEVRLNSEGILTDSEGIYTSGGATSSFNMIVYIIEKFMGREMALIISKLFALDYSRNSQSHFAMFSTQKRHSDKEVIKAQEYIEQNFKHKLSIEEIADSVAISKRNFIRRFKKATNNTPIQYIQRVKIEAAKKALEGSEDPINLVMYDVGYNDVKTFRKLFKKITGITPNEYRSKYSKSKIVA